MSNVSDVLREMATDSGTSMKDTVKMTAAAMADVVEAVDSIEDSVTALALAQATLNVSMEKDIERNTNTLTTYNRGVWLFGTTGALWLIYEVFLLITT